MRDINMGDPGSPSCAVPAMRCRHTTWRAPPGEPCRHSCRHVRLFALVAKSRPQAGEPVLIALANSCKLPVPTFMSHTPGNRSRGICRVSASL